MNIEVYEGQGCKLYIKLNGEFEVYGGTTKQQFSVTKGDEYLVEIPAQTKSLCHDPRFDIFARRASTGQEWLVVSGRIELKHRRSEQFNDSISPVEYHITKELIESGETVDGGAMIIGIKGDSAYDIAVANGYEGTEEEYTEMITSVPEYASQAADAAEQAASSMSVAQNSEQQAAAHVVVAQGSALGAMASKQGAEDAAQAAAEHADAAQASADAAEEYRNDAQTARDDAETAARAAAGKLSETVKSMKVALESAENAETYMNTAASNAELAAGHAETAAQSADAAAADKAAAEQARRDTQAAQSTAEEQARIAMEAAAAAQAPESIAAQSARPATMLLVKDELMSILDDSSLFDVDTDGQKIIVHTDRISDEQLADVADMLERFVPGFIEVVQYNHNMEVSWRDIDKYAECETVDEMRAVNPDYENDLTSDGEWIYKLTKLQYADKAFSGASGLKRMVLMLPSIVKGYRFLEKCEVDYASIWAPNDTGANANVFIGCNGRELRYRCDKRTTVSYSMSATPNMEKGELYAPEAINADSLCPSSSKLHTFSWFVPKLESARDAFRDCVLTRESSIGVLNALHTWNDNKNHPIKIGIHCDNKYDPDVRSAIDAAAVKGWTVSEVWNGTATVATYSLRPAPPLPVYAKVDTYTHEDGTEGQMLNWCHGVTSPDGKEPEELGYTLFDSVEDAREYFGLPENEMEE